MTNNDKQKFEAWAVGSTKESQQTEEVDNFPSVVKDIATQAIVYQLHNGDKSHREAALALAKILGISFGA